MKVLDKKPDDGSPDVLDMHPQDAAHAVAKDPERYEIVAPDAAALRAELRARMSVEQRVAALEAQMDDILADDEDEPGPTPPEPVPQPDPPTPPPNPKTEEKALD